MLKYTIILKYLKNYNRGSWERPVWGGGGVKLFSIYWRGFIYGLPLTAKMPLGSSIILNIRKAGGCYDDVIQV